MAPAEGNVQNEDTETEGLSVRKLSPRNSETMSSVDLRSVNDELRLIQNDLDSVKRCNARCVGVWTVTVVCAAVFVFGGGTLFYQFIQ